MERGHGQRILPADVKLEERTAGQLVERRAREFGDKAFIETTDGESMSCRDLHERSNRLAHGLADFGIAHQEAVLVMLPDTTDYLVIWAGLGKRGAIQVPVNLACRKSILSCICKDSTARRIDVDVQFLDRLAEIAGSLVHLETIILYSETGGAGRPASMI